MKTTIFIVVVVLLLLAGGAYYYFVKHSSNNSSQTAQTAMKQNQTPQMSTQKKSLFDFLSVTGSLKCTFSDSAKSSSGTVYVSSGKMRGDFQSQSNGQTVQSHIVNDSMYVYIWTDGQKTGYKISLDTLKKSMEQNQTNTSGTTNSSTTPSGPVDFHQQTNYSCAPATVDASLFTLPQDITFTDFSAMMQGVMKGISPQQGMTTQQKQSACSQCNQVPEGAMRNQCLASLKCQ